MSERELILKWEKEREKFEKREKLPRWVKEKKKLFSMSEKERKNIPDESKNWISLNTEAFFT